MTFSEYLARPNEVTPAPATPKKKMKRWKKISLWCGGGYLGLVVIFATMPDKPLTDAEKHRGVHIICAKLMRRPYTELEPIEVARAAYCIDHMDRDRQGLPMEDLR